MLEQLKQIGLSDNEAKVYTALLELGNATAQEIAQKITIPRPTVYVQLESLMKIGLVSSFEKAPTRKEGASKTYFRAEDPHHLERVLSQEKSFIAEKEKVLKTILPDLGKLFSSAGERPRVRFFDGVEGLRTMQQEYVKEFRKMKEKEVQNISSADSHFKFFPAHLENYSSLRVKHGVRSKLIYTSSRGSFLKDSDATMLRESLYIPPEKFSYSSDISIYNNKVAFSVLGEKPFGIIIENQDIADSMRSFFYLAWDAAKKYN